MPHGVLLSGAPGTGKTLLAQAVAGETHAAFFSISASGWRDFTDSLEKILLGSRRGIVLSPIDRERTAFHEAGHALVGMLTPGADPVRKISIIPRGLALGVTLSVLDDDRVSYKREDLLARIKVALGGRVAEELVYGTVTTGAESDLQQLTRIARSMVGRWGMSEGLGLATMLPAEGQGPFLPGASETFDATQQLLDEEVGHLIDNAHQDVGRAPLPAPRGPGPPDPGAGGSRDARPARRLRRRRRGTGQRTALEDRTVSVPVA
jgi:ATP-dependent Zn protease